MPTTCFEELLSPAVSEDDANNDEHNGKNMEAINVILRFLDQRLSKVEVRRKNSSRRSTSLRSGSEKCQRHALSRSSTSHRDVSIESNDSQILSTTDFTAVDRRSASFADRRTKITEQVGGRSIEERRRGFSSALI